MFEFEHLFGFQNENSDVNLTLSLLSFSLSNRELVAVVGPVGAGKSSLLMALLGNCVFAVAGQKFAARWLTQAQQAWVFSDTLRNNILCGQPLDEERYQNALQCAALLPDLQVLRSGDQTLVGERGVVLSGGQRARVSLARAMYQVDKSCV